MIARHKQQCDNMLKVTYSINLIELAGRFLYLIPYAHSMFIVTEHYHSYAGGVGAVYTYGTRSSVLSQKPHSSLGNAS